MILSDEFPTSAYKLGADIVIESAHKTLPAMTQTAFLHVQGDKVSVKDVPIGKVESVIDYEGNRTILVKPYADFDKISYVTLVGDGK